MYIPNPYKNEDFPEILEFIRQNGFGILVNQTNGRLWATHIPIEVGIREGETFLHGHISKENPQGEGFLENDQVLAIFSGPHAYISASWYDHENVPTWNYTAVHVYGKIKILSLEQTIASLKALADKYESGSENPVRIENLSEKTMRQARGVVGFEIEIEDIQAVKKLSQTRDDKNHEAIIAKLSESGDANAIAVASEMKKMR